MELFHQALKVVLLGRDELDCDLVGKTGAERGVVVAGFDGAGEVRSSGEGVCQLFLPARCRSG